ncbi:AAA family ATPase [Corynebacterium breve]|uniref:AAA family ATPase n=1 Tax=Corynebacterium breve TaxID=3049799 RepID=A0ABY8VAX0_9CORY|nr:AAA family ATPase [Corynebacterium breve]WIM66806.1 AAA family ATPase [Corynebacterium breve]
MSRDFIVTKEHRRFVEFANAIRKDTTIGICHGEAGVGKTQSARRYAHWDTLGTFIDEWGPRSESDLAIYAAAHRARTVFCTPEVQPKYRTLIKDIEFYQGKLDVCIMEHLMATGQRDRLHMRRSSGEKLTQLIIIDEAERLPPTALEMLRDIHDRDGVAIMFIGMPGIDQRFRHYPQLFSRLGFSHRYRALGKDELLFVLNRHYKRLGRELDPEDFTDAQAIAAIERLTRGNFRVVERLFPQIKRVLKINELETITDDVIEAAASTLVLGH